MAGLTKLTGLFKNKHRLDEKSIDICGAMPDNDAGKFWGDYHYAVALKKEFERRGYKANILPKERWYDVSRSKYVLVLRGLHKYHPYREGGQYYIMWNISHPSDVEVQEYNSFDYVYFASDRMKEKLGKNISSPSGVLLQCTDDEIMVSDGSMGKKYDVLFVGNSRHVYRQILKDLLPTDYSFAVIGKYWDEFPVKDYVIKEYVGNAEVGQTYHDAKILLNDHWEDMREYGIISNRIFDALSAGAFVISDYMPELDEVLKGAVVTYDNHDDLNDKIGYYLSHANEREEKAALGRSIVRGEHTFGKRVEQIIEMIETETNR